MSAWIQTKDFIHSTRQKFWLASTALVCLISVITSANESNLSAQLPANCPAIESNLPMNHSSHPCHSSHASNKTWWSWVSGESESTQLHFLDLLELIHNSFE